MHFTNYQRKAREFAVYPDQGNNIAYPALGLGGEAGEVLNQVKKVMRDDGDEITLEREYALIDELGDVLWYVANLAEELGTDLDAIAFRNLEKLSQRRDFDTIHGDKRNG